MSQRKMIALGDALEALIDHRGKTPKKLGGDWTRCGHRVVSALNVKNSRVDLNDHHYVDHAMYRRWMPVPLAAGDVLLTSEAPLGEVAFLASAETWCLGQRLFALRGRMGVLDGRYLFYLLQSGPVREQLQSRASGSTVSGIRQSELVRIQLALPPVAEQRQVAATLGALDDKIESNRRLWRTIDDLVAAMAIDAARSTSARSVELREVVDINPVSVRAGEPHELLDYIDIASVAAGTVDAIQQLSWRDAPSRARRGVSDGDVIYSTVRPERRAYALLLSPTPETVVSTGFAVLRPTMACGSSMLTTIAGSREFASYLQSVAQGSAYPAVNPQTLGNFRVRLPDPVEARAFEMRTMPLRRRAAHASRESRGLAELRDALLPELLSGRIRVPEAREASTRRLPDRSTGRSHSGLPERDDPASGA